MDLKRSFERKVFLFVCLFFQKTTGMELKKKINNRKVSHERKYHKTFKEKNKKETNKKKSEFVGQDSF